VIVARAVSELAAPRGPSVVTIGNFDGVHRGHLAILAKTVRRARAVRGTSTLVTLDPHPMKVLHPEHAPPMILPLPERVRLVEEAGIDRMLILPFTLAFSQTPAETFVSEVLVRGLRCRELYMGSNFRFGHNREGGVDLLIKLGPRHGFSADAVKEVHCGDILVSSTRVRRALLDGQAVLAKKLLGRPFALLGRVVRGEGRGRSLDFPTANLEVENELVPREGVYITRAVVGGSSASDEASHLGGAPYAAATNIGRRPTFGGESRVVEAHLLDFSGDLYNQSLRLEFMKRLRREQRFSGPEELHRQILRDVAKVRAYFRRHPIRQSQPHPGTRTRPRAAR
jgi:riboflavin kinase/FMN adenylyltransferase